MNDSVIKLESLFNQIPGHVFWLDNDDVVLGCNCSQARDLGYDSADDLVGMSLHDIIDEPYLSKIIKNNHCVRNKKASLIVEEVGLNAKGRACIYLSHKNPIIDDDGKVVGLIGVAQDITELRSSIDVLQSESSEYTQIEGQVSQLGSRIMGESSKGLGIIEQIQSIKNYYEKILALMPGHVYWVDKCGKILGCNDSQAVSFGFDGRDELVGKTFYDLLPQEQADKLIEFNNNIMHTGKTNVAEESGTMAEGQLRTYFSTKAPLKNEQGQSVGVLGISIDITERKRIEEELVKKKKEAERANNAKSKFLMNMSHDLRTPCSGILGYAKILYDQEVDEVKKQQMGYILESSEHLLELLNEIIDYTKVDSMEYERQVKATNVKSLVLGVVNLLGAEFKRKSIKLVEVYNDQLPKFLQLDSVILHRVLLNLVANAVKFTHEGEVRICVDYEHTAKQLIVKVQDTGIGIAESDVDRIFDKFTRLSSSYAGAYNGTGLGLATVTRLLEIVDGNISVKSTENIGSTFQVILPAPITPAKDKIDRAISRPYLQKISNFKPINFSSVGGVRVLVIEDDLISRQVCRHLFLEMGNVEVTVVETASLALKAFSGNYDLLVMDIGLPDMDGTCLARKIRCWESDRGVDPCVIIALTAHVGLGLSEDDFSQFNGVMQKPLTKEKILSLEL